MSSETDQVVNGLRGLADWFGRHPDFPITSVRIDRGADLIERLSRELAEARARPIFDVAGSLEEWGAYIDMKARAETAERERDAASEHARQQDERVLRLTEANEALIRERDELRAEIANLKDAGCEYRVTSHEGTSYCQLAESAVKRLTEERDDLARRIAEAQRATIDHYAEHAILDNCIRNGLSEGQHVAIVPLREGE